MPHGSFIFRLRGKKKTKIKNGILLSPSDTLANTFCFGILHITFLIAWFINSVLCSAFAVRLRHFLPLLGLELHRLYLSFSRRTLLLLVIGPFVERRATKKFGAKEEKKNISSNIYRMFSLVQFIFTSKIGG